MQFSWKNTMNGSFYMSVLVPDAGPWAACQAAGGHLARLMQTVSRGLWGTCCPSGGEVRHGMRQPPNRWQHSTAHCPNVQTTMAKCGLRPQQMRFWVSLPLIWYHIIIRKAVQKASGTCVDPLGNIGNRLTDTAVVWLLFWSKRRSNCMWLCVLSTSWCRQTQCEIWSWHTPAHTK